ncbi:MAG: hypothetical protein IT372_14650 [Polyangiaceae bacterium]|nr:hypothetical protein [Polyangiaceae bacterium]
MAELKHVLGAVLADLAHARVISDRFSGEVSEEYGRDPLLAAFPVPRVEIKEASLDLKLVINSADRRTASSRGSRGALADQALILDVGVTREDLLGTPEPLISSIRVVVQVRNYEWVEAGEESGCPIKRLRPE